MAAQRIDKEREVQFQIDQRKKEKNDFLNAKNKMLILLEIDRCERLGIPYDEKKALENIAKKE